MNILELLNQIKPYVLGWCGGYNEAAFTPTWTTSGTQPSLGNGNLDGRYVRVGNQVTITVNLTWGSITNGGSGSWSFALPFAAAAAGGAVGAAWILDYGSAIYVGAVMINNSSIVAAVYGPATNISATSPHTWAINDQLKFTISYVAE